MPAPDTTEIIVRLAVAGLGGLAVGIERELSTRESGSGPRFAGVRTFFLMGLAGGVAATLQEAGASAAGVLTLGAMGLLVVAAYVIKARQGEPDATTEVSAVVVLAAGVLAGLGYLPLSSCVFAVTWFVLAEKGRIHSMVYRIEPEILEAAARFSVLALVVLPLLPTEALGPSPGFRPRELWIFVLLFSGVSFVGFLALKALGPSKGYGLAGLLGGAVSSTAVTLSFSRESRSHPEAGRALGLGVIAACTVVYVRVLVMALVLGASVGLGTTLEMETLPFFAPPFAVGFVLCLVLLRSKSDGAGVQRAKNPLRLKAAIQMAIVFQVFLYLVDLAKARFGDSGVLASASVLGLADMDALTYSMVKFSQGDAQISLASKALAIGMLSNTVVKLIMAVTLGRGDFRRVAGLGLLLLAVASAAALWYV